MPNHQLNHRNQPPLLLDSSGVLAFSVSIFEFDASVSLVSGLGFVRESSFGKRRRWRVAVPSSENALVVANSVFPDPTRGEECTASSSTLDTRVWGGNSVLAALIPWPTALNLDCGDPEFGVGDGDGGSTNDSVVC